MQASDSWVVRVVVVGRVVLLVEEVLVLVVGAAVVVVSLVLVVGSLVVVVGCLVVFVVLVPIAITETGPLELKSGGTGAIPGSGPGGGCGGSKQIVCLPLASFSMTVPPFEMCSFDPDASSRSTPKGSLS